ncbi:hypothetical protein [Flavobacterium sp.]|uniref:hypothetical protein n=1 Tax=Flavobacterium sp. TaxID=239 RepID=UPI002633F34E|nr:hypothetical protein [Flavobacterium sp.]
MLNFFLSILTGRPEEPVKPVRPDSQNTPQSTEQKVVTEREIVHLGFQFKLEVAVGVATLFRLQYHSMLHDTKFGTKLIPATTWFWKEVDQFKADSIESAFQQFLKKYSQKQPGINKPKAHANQQDSFPIPKQENKAQVLSKRLESPPEKRSRVENSWTGEYLRSGTGRFTKSNPVKGEYESFFVEIKLGSGIKKTLKGVMLQKAVEEASCKPGDFIRVDLLEKEVVEIVNEKTLKTEQALMGIWHIAIVSQKGST